MDAGGDPGQEGLRGQQPTLRSIRQQVRLFVQNGISIPGFDTIQGSSNPFLNSLVNLARKEGDPDGAVVDNIAAFLARAMVPYSRIASFAIQPNDPHEYRAALAEGVQRAVGLSPTDISANDFFRLLNDLVMNVDVHACDLAQPFRMLHTLVTDFLQARYDISRPEQYMRDALQYRAFKLKDGNYWDDLAASLFQSFAWLNQNPKFIDSATMPPLSWDDHDKVMAREFDGKLGNVLADLRCWKNTHMILVSDAVNQQRSQNHPRDEVPDDDESSNNAAKPRRARFCKRKRMAARNRAQRENEEANIELNGEHTSNDVHKGDIHADLDDDTPTAGRDEALPSIENTEAQGYRRDLPGYEADGSEPHVIPPRQQTLECSDFSFGDGAQNAEEEQSERASAIVSLTDRMVKKPLKEAYEMVDKILTDAYELEHANTMAEIKVLEKQRQLLHNQRTTNREITQKRLDAFWGLMDRSNGPQADQ